MTILNDGGYQADHKPPLVKAAEKLKSKRDELYKEIPFFLYCNAIHCADVKNVHDFLEKSGASLLKFVQDTVAGEDPFQSKPLYVDDAFALFESLK